MQWHRGITWPGQLNDFPAISDPTGEGLVTGTQQDADLILAWTDEEQTRVVLIEARGYTSWDNAQATAKLARIGAIKDAAGSTVDIRFVLTSPRPPEVLDLSAWPTWALTTTSQPFWLKMPTPPPPPENRALRPPRPHLRQRRTLDNHRTTSLIRYDTGLKAQLREEAVGSTR